MTSAQVNPSQEAFGLPASFAQQRLWFLDRLEPDGAAYNVPLATRLRGPLDVDALGQAVHELAERHEALRTAFTVLDDVPQQLIMPSASLELQITDLSAAPDAEARAAALVNADARLAFDLSTGPLLRASLLRMGPEDHILLLTAHHIIVDAWSMSLLNRELSALYGGYVSGAPAQLPELTIQYADYAVWQQEWMRTGGLDQQLAYWTKQLDGAPALLELPTDHPRPARQSFRGATVRRMLPVELLEGVHALGEREGATSFMTLLTVFAALMSRYSGQEEIVVASPVANRSRVELEGVIGLFVNTLAMRVDLEGNPSFGEVLRRVRETSLGAFSNQDLPFEKLVEELNPERHLSHAPVAQVLFVMHNAAERVLTFPDLAQERLATDRGTAKFDLSFFAAETPEGLRLSIEYCSDLFEEATVLRMLDHYRVLLEAAIADPSRRVGELTLLSPDEGQLVLGTWNQTERSYPSASQRPVHELVAEQARRSPDQVAVQGAGAELSYAELDLRANQLAGYLRDLGVGPDVVVAVCAERSVEMVVGVLATLKAGGAYAPIDPAYPTDRVAFMLADSGAPVVLTHQHLAAQLPSHDARTVCLDTDWETIASHDHAPAERQATLDSLAYVIYTSGSTGRPKGVAMSHRPLANLLAWQLECWSGAEAARTLQFASLSFDVAFQEIFSTLCSGGTLVLPEEAVRRDPQALLALLDEQRVERLFLPFVALQNLCEAADYLQVDAPYLREVITAGEQLKATDSIRGFFTRHPKCTLVNQYGPTESHVVTAFPLAGAPEQWPSLPPIGRPIANARVYLLDRHEQPVPVGVPGELYIGGASLAREYLGRPELTRERFVTDPFGAVDERLYRTGDLARYLPDGNIEYLGRTDHQVKIRGFRIEPGEIEGALRDHPAIREALVLAQSDDGDEKRLIAYLIGDTPAPSAAELREHLDHTLPDYMIPSAFVTLDAFPLSPNGKIDRSALPAPGDDTHAKDEYTPPGNADEYALVEIWERLLKVDRVGIHDNFFALGGHSLLATQVVSRVRDALELELPLRLVFEAPTVASFARAIGELRDDETTSPAAPMIEPVRREWRELEVGGVLQEIALLPASFAEQRLWFLDRLEPGSGAYNLGMARRLHGHLDLPALERALSALIERHESLRTTFAMIDGVPNRVIHAPHTVRLAPTDVPGTDDGKQAGALVLAEAGRGFDLESGPLLRASVLRLGDEEHILILTLHHIIVDGWSMGVLNRELGAMYAAFVAGAEPELPILPLQYGDYAAWQQQWVRSGGLDDQLDYWTRQLAGAPALLELPSDHPRPPQQSFRGAVSRDVIPGALLERLKVIGGREGTTLFMTLLAAFTALLSRYSSQEDIVVASPVANRERSELEGLIGFFVNTLPLRIDLTGEPSFRELLARVRETALGGFSNQDLPFEKLVEELNPERHLSYSPVAQVLFLLQTAVGENSLELAGLSQEPVHGSRVSTKFDLSMYAVEAPEGLRVSLEYSTDLYDEATVTRMLGHYRTLLEAIAEDPDRPAGELPILPEPERRMLLVEWNDTATATSDGLVQDLIAGQARRTPTAIAAQYADEELTYGELDARANQLAHHLVKLGVEPGTLVGISVERSLAMVVGVLGILKAGGAYVPIDPAYPAGRQAYMLANSQAPVLVSQEHLRPQLTAGDAKIVTLDGDWPSISQLSTEAPSVAVTPSHLSYVIYTSGSTGEPKGVQLPQRALVNLLTTMRDSPGMTADDILLAVTTLSFDIASLELLLPLISGGRVVIAPASATSDPHELIDLIDRCGATVLQATPTTWKMLVDNGWSGRQGLKAITGGEALTVALADALVGRGLELWNCYGPSETTIYSTREHVRGQGGPITIGRPLANTKLYILDRRRQPVPVGVPGELCIGGVGLADGYRGRPDLTEERFVLDPFDPAQRDRIYRTGDLARYLPDGRVEYLGRSDHQVKIRGFRIELGEIEATLRRHPAVRDAVVIARDEDDGDKRLVAYVTADAPGPGAGELRALVQQSLPDYMVPSAFVALEEFPQTPNGKIDRKALPAPDDHSRASAEYVPPGTELERSLAELWQELLKVERVSIHDDFFALGGHSLLATRLVLRVRDALGLDVPLRTVFESPTIASFAATLAAASGGEGATPSLVPLTPAPRELQQMEFPSGAQDVFVLPASFAEQRLWFLDRLEPNNPAYNVPLALRLEGELDVEALDSTLNELVRRHEPLRTTFALVHGEPHQVVAPNRRVSIQISDLVGLPDAEARGQQLVREEVRAGFDLSAGPLFRASLIRVRPDDHILLIVMHHIIVDGWSIGVFNRELSSLYRSFRTGEAPALAELQFQYGDYAVWQQEWMRSGGLDQQLDYWRHQLAAAPALLELPTDRPRPPRQSYEGAIVGRVLPMARLEEAKRLGEREGTTLFMTLLAAFMALLSRYTEQDTIVVATPVANRSRLELEGMIGFFVNTLPICQRVDEDVSFRELLREVRETALGAFGNQDLPFEKLVEVLNPNRQLSFPPLAQVSFALNKVEGSLELDGLRAKPATGTRGTTKFDLSLNASDTPDGLRLSIEYSSDLFDEATAGRMLSHYVNLLESAVSEPELRVGQLKLMDDEERDAALRAWPADGVEYPVACMHERFESQAAERPSAIAATFEGASITYAELNARANRLARRLRALGAAPGSMVALLLEPSFEMLVAILGVLKAGAGYVPLDSEYPSERLAFSLQDTGAPIIVTVNGLLDRLPGHEAQVVSLDPEEEAVASESALNLEGLASPEDLAYVIYTSGSTGQPKGVQIEHRQVARLFSATDGWYRFGPKDTWTMLHSYAFDFSVWELWGALAHGGRLVITPRSTTRAPRALAELIADEQVTVMNATPSLFLGVQDELLRSADRLALRVVIFGGEALHPPALRPWFRRFGDSGPELVNMYGITETTVHVTYRPLRAADCEQATSPIGPPIPDLSLYLLDRWGEPVPQGVTAELFVGGAGLARGYLHRPELTAQRFIENPFGAGRLYRTGDIARRLGDGQLDFRGRSDDQVKIRGFRIELGEVKVAVGAHPAVIEAAVIASASEDGDPRLVAYVVSIEPANPPGPDELRAFVAKRLPPYMIPTAWVFLDALPLTRNGKLDEKALPAPEYSRAAAGVPFVAPSTATEIKLARIWADVLGVQDVGVYDNFFELGGHSMLAVRLFAEVERKLDAQIPISALFEAPTIAALADIITRDHHQQLDWSSVVKLRDGDEQAPLFLVGWAGGEVLPYRDLVQNLNSELSVFGLRAPGVDRRTVPKASVEELASHYVREIRGVQPHGPYKLGGFCFSGLIAYEMAGQLLEQGEDVGLLALIDTYPHREARNRPRRIEIERTKFNAFRQTDRRGKRAWVKRRAVGVVNRVRNAAYLTTGPQLYEALAARKLEHLLPRRPWNLVLVASNLARERYVPKPLPVKIAFFRAQTTAGERPTPWDEIAGRGVEVRQVVAPEINHERMMHDPYVHLLAAELDRTLSHDDSEPAENGETT